MLRNFFDCILVHCCLCSGSKWHMDKLYWLLLQFVEVIGPDGKTKRFAKGTRSGFAVERFNKLLPNDMKPVVCIAASKEGEEPIEFGPDVELILYDKAWKLQAISEGTICFTQFLKCLYWLLHNKRVEYFVHWQIKDWDMPCKYSSDVKPNHLLSILHFQVHY